MVTRKPRTGGDGAGTFAIPAATAAERPAGLQTIRVPLDDIEHPEFWQRLNQRGLNGTPLYFRPFIEAKPQRIAAVLTAMARAQPGGVIFHCGGGRDRAGLISLLMLSLAGVTPAAIAGDYALSLGQAEDFFAALGIAGRQPGMHGTLRQHGTTVRRAILAVLDGLDVVELLRSQHVSDADIATLRHCLAG